MHICASRVIRGASAGQAPAVSGNMDFIGSVKLKKRLDRKKYFTAVCLCVLFFLFTFGLYSIVPREFSGGTNARPDADVEAAPAGQTVVQTVPIDNPVTGMYLTFSAESGGDGGSVRVTMEGGNSAAVYADEMVTVSQLPEDGVVYFPFSQTAYAGRDAYLVVTVASQKDAQNGAVTALCTSESAVPDGDLTVDGISAEGSLIYQLTQVREYWTWRRVAPLPYFVACLALARLAFWGKAWYEKRRGRTISGLRDETWWHQAICGGFLLICGIFFMQNAIEIGIACSKPEYFSQIRRLSLFSQTVMVLLNFAVTGLISYLVLGTFPVERAAAASVLVIGLFYMVAITPLSPPDEAYHYQSAYNLSNYMLFRWDSLEMGDAVHFDYSELTAHENVSSAYLRLMTQWNQPGTEGELVWIPTPRGLAYPIEMIPQAVGLSIGRLLNLNFLGIFYLGRLTNLLFFSVCVYFAVKRIPRFQTLMALAALLPMTLQQAASYSYDAFINGMAFLFVASLIREYTAEGKMTRKDFLWLLIPGVLLVPAKAVYSAILLPALLIPTHRFGGTKQKWGTIAGVFLICAGILVAVYFPNIRFRIQTAASEVGGAHEATGEPLYSIGFILNHPGQTFQIFLNTLKQDGLMWVHGCIGWALSGLSLIIPLSYVHGFALLLILAAVYRGRGEVKISPGQRAAFLGCSAIVILLTLFIFFTGWTAMGDSVVQGIQGRYFLPVLPLLCMAFSGNCEWKNLRIEKALLPAAWVLNMFTIQWVFERTIL